MASKRRNLNIEEQFQVEQARGQQFLAKLNAIKKTNKVRKERTKLNQHKLQWRKQNSSLSKQQTDLQYSLHQMLQKHYQIEAKRLGRDKVRTPGGGGNDEEGFFGQILKLESYRSFERSEMRQTLLEQVGGVRELIRKKSSPQKVAPLLQDIRQEFEAIQFDLEHDYRLILQVQYFSQLQQVNELKQNFNEESKPQSAIDIMSHLQQQAKLVQEGEQIGSLSVLQEYGQAALGQEEVTRLKTYYKKLQSCLCQIYVVQMQLALEEQKQLPQGMEKAEINKWQLLYDQYIKGGKLRSQYFERLEMEFPGIEREVLEAVDAAFESKRWVETKVKSLLHDYEKERESLKQRAVEMIEQELNETIEKSKQELRAMKHEAVRSKCHADMEEKRIEYEAKQKVLEEIARTRQEERQREQQEKQNDFKKHAKEVKIKAQEYLVSREKRVKEEIQARKAKEEQQEKKLKLAIQEHKEQVQKRQKESLAVIEERNQKYKLRDEENKENQERINRAIEKYSHRPKVEKDTDRLNQATTSIQAKHKEDPDLDEGAGLYKETGFSMKNMMKDVRFKISTALHEAGLSGTAYGNELLRGLNKPTNSLKLG